MPERTACRLMFIACCLLPTMLVVGWTAAVHSPPYLAAQRRALEAQFTQHVGLAARMDDLRQNSDGAICLGSVEVLGANGRPLLVAEDVTIHTDKQRLQCDAARITLHRNDLERLWETLDHRALRSVGSANSQWQLNAAQVNVAYGESESSVDRERYNDLAVVLRVAGPLRSCEIRFVNAPRATTTPPPPIELLVAEDVAEQVTRFKLLAGSGLPARLVSRDLRNLTGEHCWMHGQVHALRQHGQWTARVVDTTLKPVDFSTIASTTAPFIGQGQIVIRQAQLIDGRLNVAEGQVTGGSGQVAPQTLQSLARYLEVEPVPHSDRSAMLTYEQLSVEFKLHNEGLDLRGNCPSGEHVILADRKGDSLLRSREYWARRERVLRGLAFSAADGGAIQRRAPYPVAATTVTQR